MLSARDRNRLHCVTHVRKMRLSVCLITSRWVSAVNMSKTKFWLIVCLS